MKLKAGWRARGVVKASYIHKRVYGLFPYLHLVDLVLHHVVHLWIRGGRNPLLVGELVHGYRVAC